MRQVNRIGNKHSKEINYFSSAILTFLLKIKPLVLNGIFSWNYP